jgi:hypothetical protein
VIFDFWSLTHNDERVIVSKAFEKSTNVQYNFFLRDIYIEINACKLNMLSNVLYPLLGKFFVENNVNDLENIRNMCSKNLNIFVKLFIAVCRWYYYSFRNWSWYAICFEARGQIIALLNTNITPEKWWKLIIILNTRLDIVIMTVNNSKNFNHWKLKVNLQKTKVIIFCKRK